MNAGNNRYSIDRKEVDTALAPENFNQILTQALEAQSARLEEVRKSVVRAAQAQ